MGAIKRVKKSILMATLVFMAGTSVIKAGNGLNAEKDASGNIATHIAIPEQLKKQGFREKVKVRFTVNENGKVNGVVAVTANRLLRLTVEKQFLNLSFVGLKSGPAHTVVLNFNVY